MANALRRSKKQPEYDPNELADLIAVPAVGSGVGSHLLLRNEAPDPLPLADTPMTTVVTDPAPTVVIGGPSPGADANVSICDRRHDTVVISDQPPVVVKGSTSVAQELAAAPHPAEDTPPTTVVTDPSATVGTTDSEDGITVALSVPPSVVALPSPPVAFIETTTVAISKTDQRGPIEDTFAGVSSGLTTVAKTPLIQQTGPPDLPRLWMSESGEVVTESRVRPVRAAEDALSSGEATVYDVLWRCARAQNAAGARSIQAGYHYLTQKTRLSRKTIQRTIDRLIAKRYIEIETQADIYQRTATVYRVYAADVILDRLLKSGRTHVAKIGSGIAFVTRLNVSTGQGIAQAD